MKVMKKLITLGVTLMMTLTVAGCSITKDNTNQSDNEVQLSVSAAASLREAMEEIQEEYKKENENIDLVINFGSSGSLQRQIEQGAPCDVFISAGKSQMDALEDKGLLLEGSNEKLVLNELVLVSHKDSNVKSIEDLTTDKVSHIALGDPESVPAGRYANEALTNLELKDKVNDKLVFAKDVKEVLAWTSSQNADVGFVYYSDAINSENVKIVETSLEGSYSEIVYPIAVIKDTKQSEEAKAFEDFLLSEKGQEILIKYGYKSVN